MKLIQLEYFCAVSRYHSITQAAQKLYVTQPAISSAIRGAGKEFLHQSFYPFQKSPDTDSEGKPSIRKPVHCLATIHETDPNLMTSDVRVTPIRDRDPPVVKHTLFSLRCCCSSSSGTSGDSGGISLDQFHPRFPSGAVRKRSI